MPRTKTCCISTKWIAPGNVRAAGGVFSVCVLTVFVACSSDSATSAPPMPSLSVVQASVTGAAANAIGSNGQFQLGQPNPAGEHELAAPDAINYATLWTRDYAPMDRAWLESTHGGPIVFKTLRSCGRPLYARSAFDTSPRSIPAPYRRAHGPWWLITFCDEAGAPSVSVAVSAWATELTVEAGRLRFPRISGTEFVPVGIPVGHIGEFPMAPEIAVQMAAEQSGKRIATVPDLITPLPRDGPPQLARWHITLEAGAMIHTNHGSRVANEIFVGPKLVGGRDVATLVAAPDQPTVINLLWSPVPRIGEPHSANAARATVQTTKIMRRTDTPISVEPVSAWGN
jgi:hypothetical protein